MNVLIIPEDFTKDQFILAPLVQRMLRELGKPNAKVRVCMDPRLGGINEALKLERVRQILESYKGMVHLFLLLVDRDGVSARRAALGALEDSAQHFLSDASRAMFGENAWQEIEVWALAGQTLPPSWRWQEVRNEVHAKEKYFEPFVRVRGLTREPGQGRLTLGREAAENYQRVRTLCPEDVMSLETRIRQWLLEHVDVR